MSSEKKEKKQHKMNFNIKEKLKKTFSKEHLKEVFTGEEQKKHLKQGSYSSIMTVIVLAVIVVINLIVAQIPTSKTQIDLSTQKMYSITDRDEIYGSSNRFQDQGGALIFKKLPKIVPISGSGSAS